jgi:hypothetical protein
MVLKIIAIKDFKEAKLPSLDNIALQVQSRIRKLFISLKIYISFYVHLMESDNPINHHDFF